MRRLHLVELEDLPWFPAVVRDQATDFLRFASNTVYPFAPFEARVAQIMRACGATRVVDLCSGGGGPLAKFVAGVVAAGADVQEAYVTDLYPNKRAFEFLAAESGGRITAYTRPVDATAVPRELDGMRTIFNAFHHFPPTLAQAILQNAVDMRQPIGVFELVERRMAPLIPLATPLLAAAVGPFLKPFHPSRVLLSWLLPLMPALVAFDGFISCLRVYSPSELDELIAGLKNREGYRFETGVLRQGLHKPGVTYLLGWPEV